MISKLSISDQLQTTHIRFRNVNDYEAYINAVGQAVESEDAFFNGYVYKVDTFQFN